MAQSTQSPPAQYAELFRNLTINNQLALLGRIYVAVSGSMGSGNPDGTAPDTSEGLFSKVKEKSHEEQLQVMRDLLTPSSTDIRKEYEALSNNTKLAFWYRLAQGMENSTIVSVPTDFQLSDQAQELLSMLELVGFEMQYIFLRDALLAGY